MSCLQGLLSSFSPPSRKEDKEEKPNKEDKKEKEEKPENKEKEEKQDKEEKEEKQDKEDKKEKEEKQDKEDKPEKKKKKKKQEDGGDKKKERGPQRKALLIGLQYDKQIGQLHGSYNDVKSIAAELKASWGYTNVVVMTDENGNQKTNRWPTRQNIQAAIKRLLSGTKPGDRLYFHFSGHGNQQWDGPKVSQSNESDGKNEVIIDREGNEILDDHLHQWLVKALPKGVGLVAFMDCCDSGTDLDLQWTWNPRRELKQIDRENSLGAKGKLIVHLAATLDPDLSYEDKDSKGNSYGAFTLRWLNFLRDQKKNPSTPPPTWQELIKELHLDIKKADPPIPQTPLLSATDPALMGQPFTL